MSNGTRDAARRVKAALAALPGTDNRRGRILLLLAASALLALAFALTLAARPSPRFDAPPLYAEFSDTDDIENSGGQAAILEAGRRGLFEPYPDGTFRPDSDVTRAQFALALWRLAGQPEISGKAPFSDISSLPAPSRAAIAWSFQKGYLDGVTNRKFAPDEPITRQAAMNALFQYDGGNVGLEGLLSRIYDEAIADSGEIADWAKEGMYWAIYHELIVCDPPLNAAEPEGRLSRALAAEILVSYADRFQTQPTEPAESTQPTEPTEQAEPTESMEPTEQAEPTEPTQPTKPTE